MIKGLDEVLEEGVEIGANAISKAVNRMKAQKGSQPESERSNAKPAAPQFTWSDEGRARIERVPVGFMRDATRQHIENYAFSNNIKHITLEVAEAGIAKATAEMEAVLSGASSLDEIKKKMARMSDGGSAAPETENPLHFCGMCGHVVRNIPESCPVCEAKRNRFVLMREDVDYFICMVCSLVSEQIVPEPCSLCGAGGEYGLKLERKESLLKDEAAMSWTDAATAILEEIPQGFMRDMTRWRIEADARKKGVYEIDPSVVKAKYTQWTQVSKKVERRLAWDDEAITRIALIPSFVRGTVVQEIESCADEKGLDRVTLGLLNEVTERWAETMRSQGLQWKL